MKTVIIAIVVTVAVLAAVGGLLTFILIPPKGEREEKPKERPAPAVKENAVSAPVSKREEPEESKVEEAAEEDEPEEEPEEEPETETESESDDEDEEENVTERRLRVENGEVKYIIIKYNKSFQAKLIQGSDETKEYYSRLKNRLLSYCGVKSRMSWKWETFNAGRKKLAKLRLRGKTLSIALALDPAEYEDTKYIVESIADVKSYVDTPCLYRIKNDRRVKYACELIDKLMTDNGLSMGLIEENVDYVAQYPYETTAALLERKLIKELTDEDAQSGTVFRPSDVRGSVSAVEADRLMQDDVADILLEKLGGESDRTRTGIVNIDTLSKYFEDEERVTLEEIKKRVKDFDRKVTYVKVLARGTLDKRLTVEADNFSLQAVKMIVLTGGKAIKK